MDSSFMNTVQNMRSRRTQPIQQQQQPNYVQMQPQVQQQDPTDYLLNIFGVAPQTQQQPIQQFQQAQALLDKPEVHDNQRQMATISMLRTQLEKGIKPEDLYKAMPESNRYLLDTILNGGL